MTEIKPTHEQGIANALAPVPSTITLLAASELATSSFESQQTHWQILDPGIVGAPRDYDQLELLQNAHPDNQQRLWQASQPLRSDRARQKSEAPTEKGSSTRTTMIQSLPILERLALCLESTPQPINLAELARCCTSVGVRGHLAILTQPYLERVVAGTKTVESRFSKVRGLPFQRVGAGDVLLLKEVTGPIYALCMITDATFFGPLGSGEAVNIMAEYREVLQLEPEFIAAKCNSAYVSLVHLGAVHSITPLRVNKTDRRAWVLLDASETVQEAKIAVEQPVQQLSLFVPHTDCTRGLHRYYDSKLINASNYPICRYCGIDNIDWARVHRRDIADIEHTIAQLRTEAFRESWWTRAIDPVAHAHALRKGRMQLREAIRTRLWKSVGMVHEFSDGSKRPYRDGLQTPYTGNSIYYAQHALACCCRKCITLWHGIPNGRDLTNVELDYFVALVMDYIDERLPELTAEGTVVPRQRRG